MSEIRREVLGDEHVDRAEASTSAFTADFQELLTRYAWGEIWARPGLDRRMRSAVTLTALVAQGHWEELALHVRAAVRNGLTHDEIKEVLLQTAVYCGVPAANRAFAVAQRVLEPEGYARCCEALATWDALDELPRIAVPTLCIAGEDDPTAPPAELRRISDAIPGARTLSVPGRHLATAEFPDRVNAELREFVA